MKYFVLRLTLLICAACLATSLPLPTLGAAAPSAKLTFRRGFKSSTSAFEVSSALRAKMFELTGELNHFQGQDLDVHRKIANLGQKTFRWEQASEVHEVAFNYTLNSAASQLLQIFEGLARQQELLMLLERRMKYDRLGINDALLQFESDLNHKLLPEPQRALPALDQIASDPRFVEIGRQRARALAERIRHQG